MRQLPEQPRFDRAETEVVAGGGRGCLRVMVQHPANFAGAEIRVQQQSGALAPVFSESLLAPVAADFGGSTVLPDQGGPTGTTGAAAPEHCGFPLVGDSATHHGQALRVIQLLVQLDQGLVLAVPDRVRILLHPAIGWVVDRQGGGSAGQQ